MMERLEETSHNLYSLAVHFCYHLCEELDYHKSSRRHLTLGEYEVLKAYYRGLNFRTVKYIAHSEARLLRHVIKYITGYPQPPRILDAGCGLGSQAIFFSLLGADVVGIDLNKERLGIANKRVKYYQEKHNKRLHVKFCLKNILKYCEPNKFDIVWSNQSISHIHPVQDFLQLAWRSLKNGGYLIMCDSNGINPYVAFRAWQVHRKGGLYTSVKDPDTFKQISYAREIMFNPLRLNKLLGENNYSIELIECHGFAPPQLNTKKLFRFIDEVLTHIPFIRMVGGTYIMVGKKSRQRTEKGIILD